MAERENHRSLRPTRREVLRSLGIGAAATGTGGLAAAKALPAQAQASSNGAGTAAGTAATDADIKRVTKNGAIALGPLGSRDLGSDHRLLSGEDVTFRVPASEEIANSTASVQGGTSKGWYGFQATQRGFALYAHAPGFNLNLNGSVTLQGGVLAHYTIRNRTIGSKHFTLWQGDHHDLYTYIPNSLTDAVDMLSAFDINDSAAGLSISPKSSFVSGHSVQESRLLVEFGDYLANVQRIDDAEPPSWPGRAGAGGDFYSNDDEVLFVSKTAAVNIRPWRGGTVPESDLNGLLAELRINLGSESGSVGNVNDQPGGGAIPGGGPGNSPGGLPTG